jgi:hypothetical protein
VSLEEDILLKEDYPSFSEWLSNPSRWEQTVHLLPGSQVLPANPYKEGMNEAEEQLGFLPRE